ncbi:adenine deaminase [Chitinophaga skermanii]|uniref:Adenine deaminase n=1 Tax=Chitinophaga skermanii TaxID=331697 RepID=A0A327R320_9BACT|nr:adenine deaminase [Chitinophaga skermanii]RAJ10625.1 adenine deaminase [Chitinophaga skermanii]
MNSFEIAANLIDIEAKRVFPARITVQEGVIKEITPIADHVNTYILPGFIDAHVHIESSMLVPSEFARLAVVHGTIGTVSDPHEIANVCGVPGVEYMLENGQQVPFYFNFGAPSCVPATIFETAGATITPEDVDKLLAREDVKYLTEMMNFPGVLHKDPGVLAKLAAAKKHNKPVDGHAPGLRGEQARQYIEAGISTDHECFTIDEAIDKLNYGMKILIREGSAAKNFEALVPLIATHPKELMFCSDDKHPDSLVEGHINLLVKRALEKGYDLYDILQAACINPVTHYKLSSGLLRVGDPADFIEIDNPTNFNIMRTFIQGEQVSEAGRTLIQPVPTSTINQFNVDFKSAKDFAVKAANENDKTVTVPVIEALDGQLITPANTATLKVKDGLIKTDTTQDVLKIAVVNRYNEAPVATAFIKNFGLKKGAIASTVAHDSHNIIVVGVDDQSICEAVNLLIDSKGGISIATQERIQLLPLPVAGLMSTHDGYDVALQYSEMDKSVKQMGSKLSAPFMTLSFMALLVIPHLKLSDKGLFDGDKFDFVYKA